MDQVESGVCKESKGRQNKASQARTMLNSVLMKLCTNNDPGSDIAARYVREKARSELERIADNRLRSIMGRTVPRWNKMLNLKKQDDVRDARRFSDFYSPLFSLVTGRESLIGLLDKLARENERLKLFSYRSDVKRDPFDMVSMRSGDCESYAIIFKMLAEAAGYSGVGYHHFPTSMNFTSADFAGVIKSQSDAHSTFARHTILACDDADDQVLHFDPVFGRQVDPEFYGKDANRYLMRKIPYLNHSNSYKNSSC